MSGRSWQDRAPCGTDAGYKRHWYAKRPIDDACQEAHARKAAERRNLRYVARIGVTPEVWAAMSDGERADALRAARIRPKRSKDPQTGRFVRQQAVGV